MYRARSANGGYQPGERCGIGIFLPYTAGEGANPAALLNYLNSNNLRQGAVRTPLKCAKPETKPISVLK